MMPRRARGIHLATLVFALSLCAVVLLAHLSARGWLGPWLAGGIRFLTLCPYRALTGTPCPLCGTTRAFLFLLQGDLRASLHTNPLAVVLTPMLLAQPIYRLLRVLRPTFKWREEAALLVLCLAAGLTVSTWDGVEW
jgi:hypothetical protein